MKYLYDMCCDLLIIDRIYDITGSLVIIQRSWNEIEFLIGERKAVCLFLEYYKQFTVRDSRQKCINMMYF